MNSSSEKYKICIVSDQLAGGGAERCSALLSQFFEKNNGSVHHVLVMDKIEYDYAGEVLNLGKLKKGGFNLDDRFNRFFTLYKFFRKNQFDFIIDTRAKNKQWQELIITKFIYTAPSIFVVHSYLTELYFPKWHYLAKCMYRNSYKIIAVSNKIKGKILSDYHYNQVQTIYNPMDLEAIEKQSNEALEVDFKYILAVGNMHIDVKQFDKLIAVYAKSDLPNQNIKLVIIGEGILLPNLKQLAKDLNLEDKVIFKGSIANPFPYYKKALFTVLSSKNEGFPTVLLESLACETPVVSYDCLSGPSEIITDRHNGLLVENQNENQLTLALNEMVSNNELYLQCKNNAKSSVTKFALNTIGATWLQLFKSHTNEH